jgi:hypothetical protein
MSVEDVEGFAAVLATDYPEEILCGSSRGCVDERNATLEEGARVRWERDGEERLHTESRALVLPSYMLCIRAVDDDGESEQVNVVVPGFGHCLTQRADLEFDEDPDSPATQHAPSSLMIQFRKFPSDSNEARSEGDEAQQEGSRGDENTARLGLFLETIGSLTQLTLGRTSMRIGFFEAAQAGATVTLWRTRGRAAELQRVPCSSQPIPTLTCNGHDVAAFAAALSDPANPLAKCVHRLRVRLETEWDGWTIKDDTHNPPDFKANADQLLMMLNTNKGIQYLEVIAPIEHNVR